MRTDSTVRYLDVNKQFNCSYMDSEEEAVDIQTTITVDQGAKWG